MIGYESKSDDPFRQRIVSCLLSSLARAIAFKKASRRGFGDDLHEATGMWLHGRFS